MRECHFCKKTYDDKGLVFCPHCGYDPATDAVHPSFVGQRKPQEKAKKKAKPKKTGCLKSGVNPKIKLFAYIGILVTVFSALYKYNFRMGIIRDRFIQTVEEIRAGKVRFKEPKQAGKGIDESLLIDITSFEATEKKDKYKGLLLEGIFYDPGGKSFVTINAGVYSEGDSFDNVKIKKINIDSVEILVNSELKVLQIE